MPKDDVYEKRLKSIAEDYDTSILLNKTLLGCAAEMSFFLVEDVRKYMKLPLDTIYYLCIIANYMHGIMSDKCDLGKIVPLDLSHIEDVEEKIDIVLDYLVQVREERRKFNEKQS